MIKNLKQKLSFETKIMSLRRSFSYHLSRNVCDKLKTYLNRLVRYENCNDFSEDDIEFIKKTTTKIINEIAGTYDEIYVRMMKKSYKPMLSHVNKLEAGASSASVEISVEYQKLLIFTENEASKHAYKLLNLFISRLEKKLEKFENPYLPWIFKSIDEAQKLLSMGSDNYTKATAYLIEMRAKIDSDCSKKNISDKIAGFIEIVSSCKNLDKKKIIALFVETESPKNNNILYESYKEICEGFKDLSK